MLALVIDVPGWTAFAMAVSGILTVLLQIIRELRSTAANKAAAQAVAEVKATTAQTAATVSAKVEEVKSALVDNHSSTETKLNSLIAKVNAQSDQKE